MVKCDDLVGFSSENDNNEKITLKPMPNHGEKSICNIN
jgi:hypothetical protein